VTSSGLELIEDVESVYEPEPGSLLFYQESNQPWNTGWYWKRPSGERSATAEQFPGGWESVPTNALSNLEAFRPGLTLEHFTRCARMLYPEFRTSNHPAGMTHWGKLVRPANTSELYYETLNRQRAAAGMPPLVRPDR
jgi:hypothetical protein